MNSKRGEVGGIITTLVATILIVVILFIFIFGAGVLKDIMGEKVRAVQDESHVGLGGVIGYFLEEYPQLLEYRFEVSGGRIYGDYRGTSDYE